MSSDVGEQMIRLAGIMARLRGEGGCPWDREQDLRSLRPYLIEETFEVLDEMDRVSYGGSWKSYCEELGDLMFQIVFHAQLAAELGEFTIADVCRAISDKIVTRHPHVFSREEISAAGGEAKALELQTPSGAEQVLQNWAQLKAAERKRKTGSEGSVLDGVPLAAPALLRAERLTEKASRIGFDWPDLQGVKGKLEEELEELDRAIEGGRRDEIEHELGDVLFSLANLARFVRTPAEDALRHANKRFTSRFHEIEAGLRRDNIPFGKATLEQMEAHWQRAKQKEALHPPPGKVPRTGLMTLSLGLSADQLSTQEAFLKALAPLVGLTVTRTPGGSGRPEAIAVDGLTHLHLEFAVGAETRGATLELEAPSAQAVESFARDLAKSGAASVSGPRPEEGRTSATVMDPCGNTWRYSFDAARGRPGAAFPQRL